MGLAKKECSDGAVPCIDHAGSVKASAVLHPTPTATVVRVEGARGGKVITTDGPYAETKAALTGYYLIEAEDLEAAIAVAAQIPAAWNGAVEVRPVTGVPPQPRAWLTVTARRTAIDIVRRERARLGKERTWPTRSPPRRPTAPRPGWPCSANSRRARWHAVRAELLARDRRYAEAAEELTRALAGPATDPERAHRERRRQIFLGLAG